jgi:translation initiation factor 2 subunit 3
MHVLRSFDINKPGLPIGEVKGGVIGGSLIQGDFETGDEIEIRPGLYDEKKGK